MIGDERLALSEVCLDVVTGELGLSSCASSSASSSSPMATTTSSAAQNRWNRPRLRSLGMKSVRLHAWTSISRTWRRRAARHWPPTPPATRASSASCSSPWTMNHMKNGSSIFRPGEADQDAMTLTVCGSALWCRAAANGRSTMPSASSSHSRPGSRQALHGSGNRRASVAAHRRSGGLSASPRRGDSAQDGFRDRVDKRPARAGRACAHSRR